MKRNVFVPPSQRKAGHETQPISSSVNESINYRSQQINEGIIEKIYFLNPEEVQPNPYQPRKNFNEQSLMMLAESIRLDGQMQPSIVIDTGSRYVLVAGERRQRACLKLGIKLKAIVEISSEEKLEEDSTRLRRRALMENIQRDDLSVIDKAQSLEQLYSTPDYKEMNKTEFSKAVNIPYATMNRLFTILNLSDYIKDKLQNGADISIVALENLSRMEKDKANKIFDQIVKEGLTKEGSLTLISDSKMQGKDESDIKSERQSIKPSVSKFNWGSFRTDNNKLTLSIAIGKAEQSMLDEINAVVQKYSKEDDNG